MKVFHKKHLSSLIFELVPACLYCYGFIQVHISTQHSVMCILHTSYMFDVVR